jgi:Kef-type K+ transport system membrane component KefB
VGIAVERTKQRLLILASVLTAVAVAVTGMFLAVWSTCCLLTDRHGGLLIGLSMIPRAEIAMIIMQRGLSLGKWAVPPGLFGALVLVSLVTCFAVPALLRRLLISWKHGQT